MADENPAIVIDAPPAHQNTIVKPIQAMKSTTDPLARVPTLRFQCGKMDSTYNVVPIPVLINNQDRVARATFNLMYQLTTVVPPIEVNDFIEMYKTLILARFQDVISQTTGDIFPNHIHIEPTTLVPGPMAELLFGLGSYHSNVTGAIYVPALPPAADPPEAWRAFNNNHYRDYQLYCSRQARVYTMHPFPSKFDFEQKSMIMTTQRQYDNGSRQIRSLTNETTSFDSVVRFMHDDFSGPASPITYDHSSIQLSERTHYETTLAGYLASFILDGNTI